MDINAVINVLKQKYKYNDKLLNTLKEIMESMILYYGKEYTDRVYKTFIDVPIVFTKDPSENKQALQNVGVNMDVNMPIIASGGYIPSFKMVDGKIVHQQAIIIDLSKNTDQLKLYETVVHEYCHAFMSNGNFKIDGNKVFSTTGLIHTDYELGDNDIVKMTNVQIEEGMNDYDAIQISKMKHPEVEGSKVYASNVGYASILLDNEDIRKKVNSSRINGDDSWKEILGVDLSNDYLEAFDRYYNVFFNSSLSREEKNKKKIEEKENLRIVLEKVNIKLDDIELGNKPKIA